MRMRLRSAVTVIRTCNVSLLLAALIVSGRGAWMGSAAYAQTIDPQIAGGEPVNVPWLALVSGDGHFCSGVLVNPDWMITAKHCPSSEVQFADGPLRSDGTRQVNRVKVDKAMDAPSGDVKLMHLATPYPLAAYPEMDLGYVAGVGDTGVIYGVGTPNVGSLRRAAVIVTGAGTDGFGGPAVHVEGVSGSAQPGDSGGPLMINGKLVGVASTSSATGGIHDNNWYANLGRSKDLVSSAMIDTLSLNGGGISMALGREYFYSKQRIMVWINGRYAGEAYNGVPYYASVTPTNSGVTLQLGAPLNAGDYVQVGIVPGVPGNTPPNPSTARLFALQAFDTVRSVTRAGDRVNVVLSNWLVASNQRVMFWINGNYVGETYNGAVYYLANSRSGDSVTLSLNVKNGDDLQVGIVPGSPGGTPPSPSASSVRILAKAVL